MVAAQEGATEPISPARLDAFLSAAHERTAEPKLEDLSG
jgi:hypothetical protein